VARGRFVIAYADHVSRLASLCVLAVVVALVSAPTIARACSCATSLSRVVLPPNGSTSVPTDAVLRVFLTGFPARVREVLGQEYRLRDERGDEVPLRRSVVRTRLDLAPVERLAPERRYVIEQLVAYDESGARLSDRERLRSVEPVRAVWYPIASFTTAAGPSSGRILRPAIRGAYLLAIDEPGMCGPASSLSVDVAPHASEPTDVLELRVPGQGVVATAPLRDREWIAAGDDHCARDPITLRGGDTLPFELVYLDMAGRSLGIASGSVTASSPRPASEANELWARAGWRVPVVTAPREPVPASGPPGCAFGVQVVEVVDVPGAPDEEAERSVLVGSDAGRWLLIPGPVERPRLRAHSWLEGVSQTRELDAEASVEAAVASPDGPVVVLRERRPESEGRASRPLTPSPVTLRAFSPRFDTRWTRELPDAHRYGIAVGGGRVVVTWAQPVGEEARLAYARLDDATGEGAVHTTSVLVDRFGDPPEPRFVGGRHLVFWRPRRHQAPLRTATLTARGLRATRRVGVAFVDADDHELTSLGDRVGVLTSPNVDFVMLDRHGRASTRPVSLGAGVRPADARMAWMGEHFVVVADMRDRLVATVVDLAGRAAVAWTLDVEPGSRLRDVVVTRGQTWVSYATTRREVRLARLACRTSAPDDAPPVLTSLPPLARADRPLYELAPRGSRSDTAVVTP